MTTTIKITELTNIGANLASSTVIPVVNMGGTPTTEKAVLGNVANFILAGAGGNYVAAAVATTATTATTANTVLTNAQPNITSVGSLTGLTVSNVTGVVNFSNTANVTLGNVSNLHIAGGTIGQILSTDGAGNLSWASDTTTYGNSNVVSLLSAFGSNTISTTGNISVGNITATNLGNVSTINRDGNSSNVLYGNGVFAPVAGGANTGNVTFDNQAVVGTGDQEGGGGLYLAPGNASVGNVQYLRVRGGDYPTHIHLDTGNNQYFDQYFGDDYKYVKLANTGNIVINSNDNGGNTSQWTFDIHGAVTFPTLNVDIHNGGVQSAQTLQFGDPTQQAIITGPTPPTGQSAQRIIIQGQNGGTGEGGDVYLWAGDAQINGGDIKIYAGDADNVSAGSGGYINLAGGAGFDNGGDITLNGGSSANGYGGQISITGGTGQIDGGPASISGGYSATGTGGAVNITGGTSSVGPSAYGNVEIGSGIYGWTFDNTGNFKLPGSILGAGNLKLSPDSTNAASYLDIFLTSGPDLHLVASNGANLILGEDNGPNVMTSWNGNAYIQSWNQNTGNVGGIWTFNGDGNLTLPANTFAVNYANGTQVSIGGAAGNAGDIQINVAGNIGADSTLRYVDNGGEMTLYADYLNAPGIFTSDIYAGDGTPSNITLTTSYGNATWTFGADGTTQFPANTINSAGQLSIKSFDSLLDIQSANTTVGSGGEILLNSGFTGPTSAGVTIAAYVDGTLPSLKEWVFDATGNLTTPGNLVIAGNTSVFGTDAALIQPTNDLPLLSISSGANGAVSSVWIEDIGNVGTSNIAAVYANPTVGSGIVRIAVGQNGSPGPNLWDFGTDGNLTLPGNTVAINFANGSSAFGNIATINLDGSNSNVLYGNGVFAAVAGGANTGNVTFDDQAVVGTGDSTGAGGLYLAPGNTSVGNLQYLRVRGGDVATHIHLDTGNNAYYDQYFGADSRFVKLEANGNVVINADDYAGNDATWTFGADGNLTVPKAIVGAGYSQLDMVTDGPNTAYLGTTNNDKTALYLQKDTVQLYANTDVYITANTGGTGQGWTFGAGGSLTLPITVLDVGLTEQTKIHSQRKIIPPFHWSAIINSASPDPTVVYTATNAQTTSMKVAVQVQHAGLGFEMFDVSATYTGSDTYYSVSNRLNPPTITDTTVLVDLNGSGVMQITLTINSGANPAYITYDATEFGIPQD